MTLLNNTMKKDNIILVLNSITLFKLFKNTNY